MMFSIGATMGSGREVRNDCGGEGEGTGLAGRRSASDQRTRDVEIDLVKWGDTRWTPDDVAFVCQLFSQDGDRTTSM